MATAPAINQAAVRIQVSADHLSAALWIDPAAAPQGVAPEELAEALRAKGLVSLTPELQQLLGRGEAVRLPRPMLAAQGRRPVHDTPASVQLLVAQDQSTKQTHSHYDSHLLTAAAEQAIARIVPGTPGQDGVDVFGKPIARRCDSACPVQIGENVKLLADGQTLVASRGGLVRWHEGKLWIETELHLGGNVDFATGNIDFPGDVSVHGNVEDLFKLISGGKIQVEGMVEAAEVRAAQDLIVGGGIVGKHKGHCVAGHDLVAKYVSNASIEAAHEVQVSVEISNCRVICGGQVKVEHGAVLAGHMTVADGLVCHTLGSPANVATVVEVGIDEQFRRQISADVPRILLEQRKANQVRQEAQALLRNQKTLTAAEKERATELLYNASEMETGTQQALERLRSRQQALHAKAAQVVVSEIVHPGTIVRFPGVQARLDMTLKGPVRLFARHQEGTLQVFAAENSGHAMPLPSEAFIDPAIQQLTPLLNAVQEGLTK